ncbi:hypothetical protein DIPPA_03206 [Diplonema papillatum]|nr:hypothetical protein DIPPA_03206 [Diplonema papillatum]
MPKGIFEGLSVHLQANVFKPLEKIVTREGGKTVDLQKADVAIARTGSKLIREAAELGKVCVQSSWVRKCTAKAERLPYDDFKHDAIATGVQNGAKRASPTSSEPPTTPPAKKASGKKTQPANEQGWVQGKVHVALSSAGDESVAQIVKSMKGVVHETDHLLNGGKCAAFVVPEAEKQGLVGAALAVLAGVPVVSEAWVYRSLDSGCFVDPASFRQRQDAAKRVAEGAEGPFARTAVCIHGKINAAEYEADKTTLREIVLRGGGGLTEWQQHADVIVACTPFRLPTDVPIVRPEWLLESAAAFTRRQLEDFLVKEEDTADSSSAASGGKRKAKAAPEGEAPAKRVKPAAEASAVRDRKPSKKQGKAKPQQQQQRKGAKAAAPADPQPAGGAGKDEPSRKAGEATALDAGEPKEAAAEKGNRQDTEGASIADPGHAAGPSITKSAADPAEDAFMADDPPGHAEDTADPAPMFSGTTGDGIEDASAAKQANEASGSSTAACKPTAAAAAESGLPDEAAGAGGSCANGNDSARSRRPLRPGDTQTSSMVVERDEDVSSDVDAFLDDGLSVDDADIYM